MQKAVLQMIVSPKMKYSILSDKKTSLGDKVIAEAIFQEADQANGNGHRFPRRALWAAIHDADTIIKERRMLGELDHPGDINNINRLANVELKNVSHVITDLGMNGNTVIGKFETLNTPSGAILAALLKDNIKVGVSIRALTDMDVSYDTEQVNDINQFELVTYDAVHNPAYKDAFVSNILSSRIMPVIREIGSNTSLTNNNVSMNTLNNLRGQIEEEELRELIEAITTGIVSAFYEKKYF